jgi:hypothetical protein
MANLRQTIAVGNTGDELVAAFNTNASQANLRVYNVEDYGAVHNGSTDDTVAIQAAITACNSGGGGVIYFPIGIYVIGGALVGTTGGTTYNSQLTIPFVDNNNETRKTFHLLGEVCPNFSQSSGINDSGITHIAPSTGVILKSTVAGSGTNPSVICGGKYNATTALWGNGNANQIIVENIQIQPVVDGDVAVTIGGLNLRGCLDTVVKNVCCFPFNTNIVDTAVPKNNCVGIAMPIFGCSNHNMIEKCNVGGFETGYRFGEHTSFKDLVAIGCLYGYEQPINYQLCKGERIGSYWCANNIIFTGGDSNIKIDALQVEWYDGAKWFDTVQTVLDTSNYGHGEIHYNITEMGVGFNNAKFSKSGGANLQCLPIAFTAAASFTVTGVRDSPEAALKNLLTVLAAKGIIVDSTTETT